MSEPVTGPDDEFHRCFERHVDAVRRTAYLLCGDWHRAEDLTQTAFLKLYLAWDGVDGRGELTRYLNRVVTRTYLAERRRMWWRRERSAHTPPEVPAARHEREDLVVVQQALAGLPARQRAVLVLRFWLDLGVEEAAAALGCAPGTVKSQTAKGLAALRQRLGPHFPEHVANTGRR